jgi:rRNA maturation RNase YbeY
MGKLKDLPFSDLHRDILGKNYELSIAFVNEATSKKINFEHRNKNYPTNVLSFALSKKSGELILCPNVIKREHKLFEKSFFEFAGFLVIHGMLHLKGFDHGSIMERLEEKHYAKYFGGNRRGLLDSASSSRRVSKRRKTA